MNDEIQKPELIFKEDLAVAGGLKPKMIQFLAELAHGADPKDAAIRAGYAPSAVPRLMKMPESIEAFLQAREDQLRQLEVTEDKVLLQLARLAFVDRRDFFEEDGTPKNIQELSSEAAACLTSIDVEELWEGRGEGREKVGRVLKYRFEPPKGALELLGKYLKLWTDKLEVSGSEELADRLRKARQNVETVPKELLEAGA